MKAALVRLLFVLIFCTLTKFATAGDFQSVVVSQSLGNNPFMISVPTDRFLVIRNFTQVGTAPASRGTVMATIGSQPTVTVLTATIVDPSTTTSPPGMLEVINNVVVAGPASVSVACDSASTSTCFITYRKGED